MPSCLNRFPVPSLWTRRRTKKNDTHTSLTKTLLVAETPLFAYDAPPSYNASSAVFDEAVLKTIEREIEVQNNALRELSLDIHDHPELKWEERHAHDALTKFMEDRKWTVTPHYLGFETAWRAEWSHGAGGPVVGVNSEMDALPGIGHACGHNLIGMAGVGIALGIKAAMEAHNISGKVVLLGTPAEEGGIGKGHLLEKGAYKGMDVCVMCHPGPGPPNLAGNMSTLAIQSIDVEFRGLSAHAGAQPWEGRNALDAAVITYTSVSALRQQIKPTHRIHGIIEGRDWAPNVIPDYAKMRWLVRAPTTDEVRELRDRLLSCIEGATWATACEADVTHGIIQKELRQNETLAKEFAGTLGTYGYTTLFGADAASTASTDFGIVSFEIPSIHPGYAITAGPGNHTREFTAASRTQAAHDVTLDVVKALAMTGVRVLSDPDFLDKVKKEFSQPVAHCT